MRVRTVRWTPWRFVTVFGVVSLLSDMVYEGARSVIGPYLATLGASAALVGLVTGVGEASALVGRLATGPLTDRTRAYWPLVMIGYAVTMVAVPTLGLTTALWLAASLFVAERAGKAIRGPARDVMLSHAATAVGRGKGFAVHEALDQAGGVAGPLLVAAVLAGTAHHYRPAFLALAVPAVAALLLLFWLRASVPDPARFEPRRPAAPTTAPSGGRLPRVFWTYLTFTVLTTAGYATFGVLSFHLATRHVVPVAVVPVVYAAAMGVDAVAALASGWLYDRVGVRILAAVPVLTALIPLAAFTTTWATAVAGVLAWGAVLGIQESTMRAAIADIVPADRRGTAYGIFAAGLGGATLVGGLLTGTLYEYSVTAVVGAVAGIQVVALAVFVAFVRPARHAVG
ncbi:Major Facilitator Superfamily protein [Micromonospora pallida]|uniref:Major Facilitator Superfamily protein n=1 Tax=Micromonospora pallida TaxID=145854 RepID=A0A1C6TGV5_9ACTN|nr:MFS transporter [Micromonospora pallida]SCL40989.1 Major Facilitator Superfamily protein [Micromonospora pallida]